MPANLPPQYFDAEEKFRQAKTYPDKINALKEMLMIMPKHKGTDRLRAQLTRRISTLKEESQKKKVKGRSRGASFTVKREGAAQVVLVGLPNTGKSSLLNGVTKATPEVTDYPFATRKPTPGMMAFENIAFQLIDLPSIQDKQAEAWLPTFIRNADLGLLVLDPLDGPDIQMEMIREDLREWKIVLGKTPEGALPDFGVKHLKAVAACTKGDLPEARVPFEEFKAGWREDFPLLLVSSKDRSGMDELGKAIFEVLEIIRVYTKVPGQKPDLNQPYIRPSGTTVLELAEHIHKEFKNYKFARIWGSNKYEGQPVSREHVLQDGDIIEIHM